MTETLAGPLAPLRTFTNQVNTQLQSAKEQLINSAAARFATLLVLHPLDASKVRHQVTSARSNAAVRAATRGPWFKGVLAAAIGHVPYGVITFGLFAALKQRYSQSTKLGDCPRVTTLLAAISADFLGAFWLVPMETVKLRMQTGLAPNVVSAFRHGGLYNGFLGQILRDTPFRAMYLVGYDYARNKCKERIGREVNNREAIGIGAGVGALVGAVTTPLDVVKTRLMSQRVGAGRSYRNWLQCLNHTLKTEGASAMFRGFLPRVVYMAASVALFSVAYESATRFVKEDIVARYPKQRRDVRSGR